MQIDIPVSCYGYQEKASSVKPRLYYKVRYNYNKIKQKWGIKEQLTAHLNVQKHCIGKIYKPDSFWSRYLDKRQRLKSLKLRLEQRLDIMQTVDHTQFNTCVIRSCHD